MGVVFGREGGSPSASRGARAVLLGVLILGLAGAPKCARAEAPPLLSPAESAWLRAHPVLRVAPAPDFPPVEFLDENGAPRGIAPEMFALLARRLGVRFEFQGFPNWNAVVEATKRREVDVWAEATPTPERSRYMRFTRPYLEFPAVIVVRKGTWGRLTLGELAGLRVVGVANYVTYDYLAAHYPKIALTAVPDLPTALKMVSHGLADATVENVAPVTYYIAREGLTNLVVAGESGQKWGFSAASRSDWPELSAILQKGLDSISRDERDRIVGHWVRLEAPRSWGLLLWVALAALALGAAALGLVLLWNRSLRRSVRLRTEELVSSRAELEERNASLEAIRRIAEALYGSLDVETVMERAVDALMRHTRSPSVAIFGLSADGAYAELAAGKGFAPDTLRAAARLPLSGSLTGIAVATGELAVSEDLSGDGRLDRPTQQALMVQGFRSAISIPLVAEGGPLGTVNLLYHEPRSPTSPEREELSLIGKTAGLALANARHVAELQREMRERERVEAELRRARDELEERVAERTGELARANERLKELDRLKSMFIASMSHELRTPLNSIIGFTGVILQGMSGELTSRQRDQLQRVYGASKHLLALITDVIDISKIEAGRVDVYPTQFELEGLVQEAVEAVRQQVEEKGLDLSVTVPAGVRLHTDRKRLLQCLLNYVSNAVKYTEAGSVRIEGRPVGDEVELSVSDTGIGVAPEAVGKLFQPFERVDTHLRVKTPGTGLGLYLTRKLATELLGGAVSVESEPGRGSTFRLRVPRDLALRRAAPGGEA